MDKNKEVLRVMRSKEEAKNSYDKMSKFYDFLVGRSEKKFREAGLAKLNVQEGEKVLEIGFGTGHCILSLARSVGASGKVYGLDISEGMLNITTKGVAKEGLLKRVELRCGDAANLHYDDNFFDAVFMSFTLELFDTLEIPIVLQQCRRVLKKGGRIYVVAMSKEGKHGVMMKLYEWGHRKFPNYIDCRPIFVKQSIENAGFEICDVTKMSFWGLPVEIVVAKKV